MAAVAEAAELLMGSESAVALTGAGISAASGMPTFRDETGERHDAEASRWAYRQVFDRDPADWYESFWPFYNQLRDLAPSAGHYALRDMVDKSIIDKIITQNVDGLDLKAGTPEAKVLEVHGNNRGLSCANLDEQDCDYRIGMEEWLAGHDPAGVPVCPNDDGPLKPDMILVEDTYVPEHIGNAYSTGAPEALQKADTLVVIGTSLWIVPWQRAAIYFAAREERSLIIVNPQPGNLDEHAQAVIHAPAEEALPELREMLVSGHPGGQMRPR